MKCYTEMKSIPEDEAERPKEGPQHRVLQNVDDEDGGRLVAGVRVHEEREQDCERGRNHICAHAPAEAQHLCAPAAVNQQSSYFPFVQSCTFGIHPNRPHFCVVMSILRSQSVPARPHWVPKSSVKCAYDMQQGRTRVFFARCASLSSTVFGSSASAPAAQIICSIY